MTRYILYLYSKPPNSIPNTAIENTALHDGDWLRLTGGSVYLISNKATAVELGVRIAKLMPTSDSYFVCELNTNNRSGFLPQAAVHWLQKYD